MIIDTNIYSQFERGDETVKYALAGASLFMVPLNVIAELRYGFALGKKHQENESKLIRFLSQDTVEIITPSVETTPHYARVASYARRHGIALSHNDIWIAALAMQHQSVLVTQDQDFSGIKPVLGKLLIIAV